MALGTAWIITVLLGRAFGKQAQRITFPIKPPSPTTENPSCSSLLPGKASACCFPKELRWRPRVPHGPFRDVGHGQGDVQGDLALATQDGHHAQSLHLAARGVHRGTAQVRQLAEHHAVLVCHRRERAQILTAWGTTPGGMWETGQAPTRGGSDTDSPLSRRQEAKNRKNSVGKPCTYILYIQASKLNICAHISVFAEDRTVQQILTLASHPETWNLLH